MGVGVVVVVGVMAVILQLVVVVVMASEYFLLQQFQQNALGSEPLPILWNRALSLSEMNSLWARESTNEISLSPVVRPDISD